MESNTGTGKRGKRREKIIIFLTCLIIAVATWLLIKLSKNYYSVGEFRIEYINLPNDWAFSSAPDSMVYLNLKTVGFRLMRDQLFKKKRTLYIDISGIKPQKNGAFYEAALNADELTGRVAEQLGDDYQVMNITPHTMYLRFEKAESRAVKVKLNIDLSFGKQYGLYHHLLYDPDSVMIKGPHDRINTIQQIETEKVSMPGLVSNTWFTCPVRFNGGNGIDVSPSYIKVFVPVAEFTESDFEVPVSIDSLPKGLSYKVFPEKVKVRINASIRDIKEYASADFMASINYSQIANREHRKAKVNIVKVPRYARVVSVIPDKVEFLITK